MLTVTPCLGIEWLGFDSERGQVAPLALLPLPRIGSAVGAASAARTPGDVGTVTTVDSVCSVC